MAHLARFVIPGQAQHVIQRGNNRNVIFAADDDYLFYLDRWGQTSERYRCGLSSIV